MAELVYAFDLKSNGEIHTGSSPVSATTVRVERRRLGVFFGKKMEVPTGIEPVYAVLQTAA